MKYGIDSESFIKFESDSNERMIGVSYSNAPIFDDQNFSGYRGSVAIFNERI